MKCKVCGYEFDSGRAYCPMCGSKVAEDIRRREEEEMSWNTYDFPKPKKPEDIEMRWPSMNPAAGQAVSRMAKDASEGFVRSGSPAEEDKPEQVKEEPAVSPWACIEKDFPKSVQVEDPVPQPAPQPKAQPAPVQPEPAPQPQQTQQPVYQSPVFPTGAWQIPQMQPEPTWTPYGVQSQQQPQVQVPPIAPGYVPTSFTQQYASQMPQQYTQPQTAWTLPPQPAPGQPVYVTQQAQPVYIQPAPQPVYQAVPVYPQPAPAPAPAPQPEPAPEPVPAPQPEPAPAPQPEPVPQPAPAPAEKPEEQEKILPENIVAGGPETVKEEPKYEEPLYEEPLFPQSPEEPDENGRIPEKFFTFNKKNEEFQQLLNREYERLRSIHGEDALDDIGRTSIYRKDTFEPTPAQNFFHDNDWDPDLSDFEKMLMESTRDAEGDETLAINREHIRGAALTAEDLIDPLPGKQPGTQPFGEDRRQEEPQQPAEETFKSEHQKKMEAMAIAREKYFASLRTMTAEMKAVKDAEFKAQLEKEARIETPKTPEQIAAEKAEAERLAAEKEAAERAAAIEKAKAEMQAALDAQEKENEPAAPAEPEQAEPEVPRQPEQPAEAPADEEPKSPEEALMDDLNVASHEPAEPVREKTEVLEEILDDVAEETKRKEDRERSHWFLKFLLALIIVAAAAEGGTIALRHYAPDSPASIITTGIEQNIIEFAKTGFETIKAKFKKDEPEIVPEEETQPEDTGSFVLSELIEENNKNIESIVENLAIGYDPERSYDIAGLSSSELVTDSAEKSEVCKTLIAYNSSWIDFINGVSQDCLNYLKADGTAYRSAVTFDKIGQITEQFKKLEIGEIRRTADTYYAFACETIEVTQNEETAQSSGFMVYELVPVGDSLKIKDYYNITN